MLAGPAPNCRQSTTTLKYYIEKYYYTESTIYMCVFIYIYIPICLALFPNDPVSSTQNVCLH